MAGKPERRSIRPISSTNASRVLIAVAAVALIVVHGVWPEKFTVDSATVGLVVVLMVVVLLPLLESASFPGGGSLVFKKKLDELAGATEALEADEVGDDDDENEDPSALAQRAAQRLEADEVVADVLEEASRSPKLALMRLSAELDRAVHHLLMGSGWGIARRRWPLRDAVARLVELGVIPASAASAADLFTQVRNAVIHGARAHADDDILRAIDSGIGIYNAVANVPRERNFVAATKVPLFHDEGLTDPITDATGIMLRTVAANSRRTESERIYPTTRDHFRIGDEVAWVWDTSHVWGPAWYRHPKTDEVHKGWDSAGEFIGTPIDDPPPPALR